MIKRSIAANTAPVALMVFIDMWLGGKTDAPGGSISGRSERTNNVNRKKRIHRSGSLDVMPVYRNVDMLCSLPGRVLQMKYRYVERNVCLGAIYAAVALVVMILSAVIQSFKQ